MKAAAVNYEDVRTIYPFYCKEVVTHNKKLHKYLDRTQRKRNKDISSI